MTLLSSYLLPKFSKVPFTSHRGRSQTKLTSFWLFFWPPISLYWHFLSIYSEKNCLPKYTANVYRALQVFLQNLQGKPYDNNKIFFSLFIKRKCQWREIGGQKKKPKTCQRSLWTPPRAKGVDSSPWWEWMSLLVVFANRVGCTNPDQITCQ